MSDVDRDAKRTQGVGDLIDRATRVLAPAGVVTAVLYYFGHVREEALFAYFGVDLATIDFSTTDYLVRSTDAMFAFMANLLVLAVTGLVLHHLLVHLIGRATPRWAELSLTAVGVTATGLLLVGLVGLHRRGTYLIDPLAAPFALGVGALLLEYSITGIRDRGLFSSPLAASLDSTRRVRRSLCAIFVLVAIFWATANVAQQRGLNAARAFEISLPRASQAVIYSKERLQITGPGVNAEQLDAKDASFGYRYNGLRPLAHSGHRWLLLPVGWTHENGSTVILLPDGDDRVRVDLAP